jgi:hypothetical protein
VTDAADCAPGLTLNGPVVNVMGGGSSSPPTATGGLVSQGTYVLTAATVYPGVQGTTYATAQTTLQLTGAQFQEMDSSTGNSTATSSGRWMTAGTTLGLLESCPAPTSFSWSYSASGGTLTITVPPMNGSNATIVETFTLGP